MLALALALLIQDQSTVCAPNAAGQVVCQTKQASASQQDCAGRDWLLVGCSAGAHREAVRQRDAATASLALRQEVARLLSEDKCPDAVRTALAGGDINLAREAREFCALAPLTRPQ